MQVFKFYNLYTAYNRKDTRIPLEIIFSAMHMNI